MPKNVSIFGNFLTVKWQFSGGSGVLLYSLTKLNQSSHDVNFVQPIVMVYTAQNLWYTPVTTDHVHKLLN